MQRTLAFSDELNYFPGIYLNLGGREPRGVVAPEKAPEIVLRVRAALLEARDPWTGNPLVRDVVPREELFEGPYLDRAPDLLVDLHLDDGYSYNLMPSGTANGPSFRRLEPQEYLGKKGRSLPGSHRPRGFMTIAGPSVEPVGRIDAHIADLTATLLRRLGICVPSTFLGRVLWEALTEDDATPGQPLPAAASMRPRMPGQESIVESRLRALGYIE
jgi:predicted AlkP superfamily phosphohydrolase/phosphomutase